MFKNLKEKIVPNESVASKNNSSDEASSDMKNIGHQNSSRFSSISSLVSDVGSAFSKAMTAQQVQPVTQLLRPRYEQESVSEFDESVTSGAILTKEELHQRYQKCHLIAKRYKTRYLEAVEILRKLDEEKQKLTNTLTETQDKNIKRINELKENIELHKKTKHDVEENYMFMLEEKAEKISTLQLQVSLLKEGKELPPEVEEKIRKNHEKNVIIEKKKEDEIKELKSNLSHRESLLQKCKDHINNLNEKIADLQSKCDNSKETSASSNVDLFHQKQLEQDMEKQRLIHIEALENVQKEHSERVNNLLIDFEKQQEELEKRIKSDLENDMKRLREQIEYSEEQLRIKDSVIEGLMSEPSSNFDIKYKFEQLSKLVEKYENEVELENGDEKSLFEQFKGVLKTDYKDISIKESDEKVKLVDIESSYELQSCDFNGEFKVQSSQEEKDEEVIENSIITELNEENRFLVSKVESSRLQNEEIERETREMETKYKKLEEAHKSEMDNLLKDKHKLNTDLNNIKTELEELLKANNQLECDIRQLKEDNKKKQKEISQLGEEKMEVEEIKTNLKSELVKVNEENKRLININNDNVKKLESLEEDMVNWNTRLEEEHHRFADKERECKRLLDTIDELNSLSESLKSEIRKLQLSVEEKAVGQFQKEEDKLENVELQRRIEEEEFNMDNVLKENKELQAELDELTNEKEILNKEIESIKKDSNAEVSELNVKLKTLEQNNEEMQSKVTELNEEKMCLQQKFNKIMEEIKNFEDENEKLTEKNEENKKLADEMVKLNNEILDVKKEKEEISQEILMIKQENNAEINLLKENNVELKEKYEEKIAIEDELKKAVEGKRELQLLSDKLSNELSCTENEKQELIRIRNEENKKVEILKGELEEIKNKNVEEELTWNKLDEENKELQQELDELNCNLKIIKEEEEKLKLKIEMLELNKIKEGNDEIMLNEKVKEQELMIDKMKENEQALLDKLDLIERDFEALRLQLKEKEETIIVLTSEIETSKDNYLTLKESFQNIEMEKENEIKGLLEYKVKYEDDISKLEEERSELLEKINVFEFEKDKELDENSENCERIKQLEEEIEMIKNEKESMNHKLKLDIEVLNENLLKLKDDVSREEHNLLAMFKVCIIKLETFEDGEVVDWKNLNKLYNIDLQNLMGHIEKIRQQLKLLKQQFSITEKGPKVLEEVVKEYGLIKTELQTANKEKAQLDAKLDKMNLSITQFLKQINNSLKLEDVNFENKTFKKVMLKNVKEYAARKEALEEDCKTLSSNLDETVKEMNAIRTESVKLQEQLDQEKNRFLETREELNQIMRNLNIMTDEKWKVDEERQSLRKELKEINEKICNIKADFDKQTEEKLKLENQIQKSLDKVKVTSDSLDEAYKELEEFRILKVRLEEEEIQNKGNIREKEEIVCEVNKYKQQISELEGELENNCKDIECLKQEVAKLRGVNKELEDESLARGKEIEQWKGKFKIADKEKNNLNQEMDNVQKKCQLQRDDLEKFKKESKEYRKAAENFELELEEIKSQYSSDQIVMKEKFVEEKEIMESEHNLKIKNMLKDFNKMMLDKERDFQKTFEEALDKRSKDENRNKIDLKEEIESLNQSLIEMQLEKNQIANENDELNKKLKFSENKLKENEVDKENCRQELIQQNEEIVRLGSEIEQLKSAEKSIVGIESVEKKEVVHSSLVFSHDVHESISIRDYEILQMHCSDIEAQLKQIQAENIHLKQHLASSRESSLEPIIEAEVDPSTKLMKTPPGQNAESTGLPQFLSTTTSRHSFTVQQSIGSMASPRTSVSEYQFCPYPITDSTDYEYLREILLKYMTGMETETLARVVTTVMKFSRAEQEKILNYEQERKKMIRLLL